MLNVSRDCFTLIAPGEAEAILAAEMGRERFALLRTLLEEASAASSGEAVPACGMPESNVASGRRPR